MINLGKPICALCVSPVLIAKSLEGSKISSSITLGSDQESSPYNISGFPAGVESIGARAEMRTVREMQADYNNKIVTVPCYMMDANILEIRNNMKQAIQVTYKLT